jgi:hypothetical protein
LCVASLARHRRGDAASLQPTRFHLARFHLLCIALLTAAMLALAYSMLVFDSRYDLPIAAILMAFAIRFAVPPGKIGDLPSQDLPEAGRWQSAAGILLVMGLVSVQVYWASPFRTVHQDFQQSVHAAADVLAKSQARNVVVMGNGPYPEHGVGWEAGVYAAYFAGSRIIGDVPETTSRVSADSIFDDVEKLAPDAVMIWEAPADSEYSDVVRILRAKYKNVSVHSIRDPRRGEVGLVLVLKKS